MSNLIIKNYGVIEAGGIPIDDRPVIEQRQDYLYGGINGVKENISMLDGGWMNYFPTDEKQHSIYFDSMGCISFACLNVIEMIFNYLIDTNYLDANDIKWLDDNAFLDQNGKFNASDRFTAKMSGTTKNGNYFYKPPYSITHDGMVGERVWDYPRDQRTPKFEFKDYYSEIHDSIVKSALNILDRFNISYERVYRQDFESALKHSPLAVLVNAWYKDTRGEYYNPGDTQNHAVVLFKKDHIYDTYDPFIKKLSADYNYYSVAYKFTITKKINTKPMLLKNNFLYLLVEGDEMKQGLVVDGKLLTGDWDDVFKVFIGRLPEGSLISDHKASIGLADWNSIDRYNLKRQKVWDSKTQSEI